MADSVSQHIVDRALALANAQPQLPPLEVLDQAMEGQHNSDPDFEAPAGHPFSDWTDPSSAFGQLLALAFGSAQSATDWELTVMPAFAARYNLWNQ